MSITVKFLGEVKDVKDGNGGAKLGKAKVNISTLSSIRVCESKTPGKGKWAYALPSGSYEKDGKKVYTKPLFPVDATALMDRIVATIEGHGRAGDHWYPASKPDEHFSGYVSLEDVDVWCDITITSKGALLFPSKDGKMLVYVDKNDPIRDEILKAMQAAM